MKNCAFATHLHNLLSRRPLEDHSHKAAPSEEQNVQNSHVSSGNSFQVALKDIETYLLHNTLDESSEKMTAFAPSFFMI